MASSLRQILAAVRTAIAGADGTGSFNNDFTSAVIGYGWELHSPGKGNIGVCIDAEDVASTTGPTLCSWTRAAEIVVGVWQPSARQEALLDAADLLDDVMLAIEEDRLLGLASAGMRDVEVSGRAFRGDDVGIKGYAYVVALIRCTYVKSTGG